MLGVSSSDHCKVTNSLTKLLSHISISLQVTCQWSTQKLRAFYGTRVFPATLYKNPILFPILSHMQIFETACRFHLQGSPLPLKMVLIGCLETLVNNGKPTLRNGPEERRFQLHCGGSLKSLRFIQSRVWEIIFVRSNLISSFHLRLGFSR
jgi:hypothetical protein